MYAYRLPRGKTLKSPTFLLRRSCQVYSTLRRVHNLFTTVGHITLIFMIYGRQWVPDIFILLHCCFCSASTRLFAYLSAKHLHTANKEFLQMHCRHKSYFKLHLHGRRLPPCSCAMAASHSDQTHCLLRKGETTKHPWSHVTNRFPIRRLAAFQLLDHGFLNWGPWTPKGSVDVIQGVHECHLEG